MREAFLFAGLIVGAMFAITAFVMALVYPIELYACHARWPAHFKPQYGIWTDCTIQTKDGRIPAKNYRSF